MLRLVVSFALAALVVAVPSFGFTAEDAVGSALAYIGTPYRYAGNGTNGLDCAGLVRKAYGDHGIELPRSAAAQYGKGRPIDEDAEDLQPGDLVFFRDTYKRGISHVGIYIGGGEFVHAASSARRVVVDRLSHPYFAKRYAGARRIVEKPLPIVGEPCVVETVVADEGSQ